MNIQPARIALLFISIVICVNVLSDQPILRLNNTGLARGESTYFIVDVPEHVKNMKVEVFNNNVQLINLTENRYLGFVAANHHTKAGEYYIDVSWRNHRLFSKQYPVAVLEKEYGESRINVPPDKVHLSSLDQTRVNAERRMIKRDLLTKPKSLVYWQGEFIFPVDSKITSPYGVKRILNGVKTMYHSGVDFRAFSGTPIKAANNGIVRFKGNLFFRGNVVIIDHGNEIFTLYSHLSTFKVQEGDIVKKGDIIALSGSTGRVNGPHLHFSMYVNRAKINPVAFIELFNKALRENGYQVS